MSPPVTTCHRESRNGLFATVKSAMKQEHNFMSDLFVTADFLINFNGRTVSLLTWPLADCCGAR